MRKSSKGKPALALLCLVFISLLLRTGQAWLARNPAQGMATVSQLETRPVAQLKSPRLSEWQALDAAHPTSWDLKFLSPGQVISSCSPLSPGDFLSAVLFVEYHLFSSHLCVELCGREERVTSLCLAFPFVIPTRGRGKHGGGITISASVWGGGYNSRDRSAEASRSCPYPKQLVFWSQAERLCRS